MVLGDGCGEYATPIFNALADGSVFSLVDAWVGTLAYTFQIYFDFSGYSDMAIGIAKCFGITLPLNFDSPYKATSIIDFWRRWHITLSRFLRDYLYIPLGGGKYGISLKIRNLMIVMLLGGLWHGAGWTFVVWGGLHGFYLATNHLFQWIAGFTRQLPKLVNPNIQARVLKFCGWGLTFISVTVAWVFFRADSMPSAVSMIQSMFTLPSRPQSNLPPETFQFLLGPGKYLWLAFVAAIAFFAPTTQNYLRDFFIPVGKEKSHIIPSVNIGWRPSILNGSILGVLLFFVIRKYISISPTEFLYFNF
jgi:D-alanyl-lipoteichoic acid acyltransferase DltB (MBOAT superfamily)